MLETDPMVDSITSGVVEPCSVLLVVVAFMKVPCITAGFCYISEMLIFGGGQFLKNVRRVECPW